MIFLTLIIYLILFIFLLLNYFVALGMIFHDISHTNYIFGTIYFPSFELLCFPRLLDKHVFIQIYILVPRSFNSDISERSNDRNQLYDEFLRT